MSRGMTAVRLAKICEIVLGELGLTVNQYRTLSLVGMAATPSLQEMAARLAIKPPNLTTLLDGLTEAGLLVRRRKEFDRRRMTLALTEDGQRLLAMADEQCDKALDVVASLTPKDRERMLRALDDWGPALDKATTLLKHT